MSNLKIRFFDAFHPRIVASLFNTFFSENQKNPRWNSFSYKTKWIPRVIVFYVFRKYDFVKIESYFQDLKFFCASWIFLPIKKSTFFCGFYFEKCSVSIKLKRGNRIFPWLLYGKVKMVYLFCCQHFSRFKWFSVQSSQIPGHRYLLNFFVENR